MHKSKQHSPYHLFRILSYIFLSCGLVIITLEVYSFLQSKDYSFSDRIDQHFIAIMMLLWYVGLRYLNKKHQKEN